MFVDDLRDCWDEVCRNTMNGAESLPRWRNVEEGEEASSRCRDTDEEIDSESRCRDTMHRVPTPIHDIEQAETQAAKFGGSIAGSLSTIIGMYKAAVTRRINRMNDATGTGHSIWQPRFHDRIIRNAQEWYAIREYIRQNPAKWEEDRFHPQAGIASME